jgi:uncharacterized protein YggU (UPF0235/DUF167 family)
MAFPDNGGISLWMDHAIGMLRVIVRAHPGARRERVELLPDGSLDVWVQARAVEGQANAAIERAVASALGLRPRQVGLIAGHTSRHKVAQVDLATPEDLHARLMARPVQAP